MDDDQSNIEKNKFKIPIIYRDEYNIKVLGIEKLHPFDSSKWGNIISILQRSHIIEKDAIIQPEEVTKEILKRVHSSRYLKSLKWSVKVAQIIEVPVAALLPNYILQKKVLKAFRYQTGGSILGGSLALEHGWAINVGGGFHHCSADRGGGFCPYADITLVIKSVFEQKRLLEKVMIIDLDAHQGNGYARDFLGDRRIYILDIYNKCIYPKDKTAKEAIRRKVELTPFTEDQEYLELVHRHVEGALNEFEPGFVVYNAGTDILKGDPLGALSITPEGVVKRDEIVFQKVRSRNIPILMLTSGGYQRCTAAVIADSIKNLNEKCFIELKPNG